MKLVFVDTEYTADHAYATLISAGFVTMDGDELLLVLNDWDRDQLTDWVSNNVLDKIDLTQATDSLTACNRLEEFLTSYGQGEPICLVSAGKGNDLLLVFQLWHSRHPEMKHFHFDKLPSWLWHRDHFDLDTLFFTAGIPTNVDRLEYAREQNADAKHDALFDAKVVRKCFLRMLQDNKIPQFSHELELVKSQI